LTASDGVELPLRLKLPGGHNNANAASAVAAAESVGVTPGAAIDAISGIVDVCGRYRTVRRSGHSVRLILAKNPAGWLETLPLLGGGDAVVIAVNAREADGKDLSWLWDVPFESLRDTRVVASGERAADLSVRLRYAEVDHETEPDPLAAVDALPAGSVQLVGNYTAFRDVTRRLDRDR
jgi:UDP-N-acetylmuramyl tripeptide synthase